MTPNQPPAYRVAYEVHAPLATLEGVRAHLLQAAAVYGFTDVSVGCDLNRFRSAYHATAHGPGGQALTLANCLDHNSLAGMYDAALATLHALGSGCASL